MSAPPRRFVRQFESVAHAFQRQRVRDVWRHVYLSLRNEPQRPPERHEARLILRSEYSADVQPFEEVGAQVEGHPVETHRQAEDVHVPLGLRHPHRLVQRLVATYGINDHLGSLSVRELQHSIHGCIACHVDGFVHVERHACRAPVCVRFDRDDPRRAQAPEVEVMEEAGAPLPDDDGGLSCHLRQFSGREDNSAQLLSHHQLRERPSIRQFDDEMRRDRLIFGEVPGLPDVRHGENERALSQAGRAGVHDGAHTLMPGLARLHRIRVARPAVVDVVEVRAADGCHTHTHERLLAVRLRDGDLVAYDVAQTSEDGGLHHGHERSSRTFR